MERSEERDPPVPPHFRAQGLSIVRYGGSESASITLTPTLSLKGEGVSCLVSESVSQIDNRKALRQTQRFCHLMEMSLTLSCRLFDDRATLVVSMAMIAWSRDPEIRLPRIT